MRFTGTTLFGLFLVLFGLSLFFDQIGLNFLGFNVFRLWPLILIYFGYVLFTKRNYIGAGFMLLIGFAFLTSSIFGVSLFGLIWPFFIIFIGFSILFKPANVIRSHDGPSTKNVNTLNETVIFWGFDSVIDSKNFKGGQVDCVFGGFKLDLSKVTFIDGAKLELNAIFGGGEIILPRDVRVQVESNSIIGGVSNKTVSGKESDPLVHIEASAIFGGIDIRN